MNTDWRVFAVGSAVFAALTAIFGKLGVSDMNSDLATFYRTIVVLVVIAAIVFARHEWPLSNPIGTRGILFLVLSGIATGLSWICYYRALQLGPVSRVAPVDKLSVVLVVILATLLLGEKLSWTLGLGALLITAGTVLIAL